MQQPHLRVRNLLPSDTIPFTSLSREGDPLGFEQIPLDCDWTWVATADDCIVAILIAGCMHSLLWLLRIAATTDAPPAACLLLLRRAFGDAKRRGCLGFVTYLLDSAAAEAKLMRLVQRADGEIKPSPPGVWASGRL